MLYSQMTRQQLEELRQELERDYQQLKEQGLKLDMSRGKPCTEQLDLSQPILDTDLSDCRAEDGSDVRNYGGLYGIPEARRLLGQLLDMPGELVVAAGSSSVSLMFDTVCRAWLFGVLPGFTPWQRLEKVKFLCPVPGYDRHFTICEAFGIEMINVPMTPAGPDMEVVEQLVAADPAIKGMWLVPLYDNPGGHSCSPETVARLGAMPTAAEDFRIFWDNAYCIHHLDVENCDQVDNIYTACAAAGHPDRPYMFVSTSKLSFAGGGICGIATSQANLTWLVENLSKQMICYDKINQLRQARFFGDIEGVRVHVRKQAAVLRPKFELVERILQEELAGTGCAQWTHPRGGYFVSLFTPPGTAREIVSRCKQAGMILTGAGATYPYGHDPEDSNIRLAPTVPPLDELEIALRLLAVAIKLVSVEQLLAAPSA